MSHGRLRQYTWTYGGKTRRTWGFTIILDGKRLRRQGFLSKPEAMEALELLKHPAAPVATVVASLTLRAAFARYETEKARKKSLSEDQRNARHLMEVFGAATLLPEITSSKVAEYRASRLAVSTSTRGGALSPASINRPLALLRHLLRLAVEEWEVLPAVPRIRLEKERQGRLRWLTPEEAHRLFGACRARKDALADMVEFCTYTGLRQAEALELGWDRVDRARGVVLLEVTKNGRRREVPLCGPADAVLARRHVVGQDGLVFGARAWTVFRKGWEVALVAAGLEDLHFHDLRHTFASWAIQRGATLPELKDLLGHSSLAMVMRYAHLAPEHLRSAVARLDDVMALPATTGSTTGERQAKEMAQAR